MKRIFLLLVALVISVAAFAKIEPADVCTSGMVLQQNTKVLLWGTADGGTKVKVQPSWSKQSYDVHADSEGRWEVYVDTPAASYTPYKIEFSSGKDKVVVDDILIGEVWVASGQSNMEMPVKGFHNNPVENSIDYIAGAAAPDKIRMFMVPMKRSYTPETRVEATWKGATPETVPDMSATAYFFARKLNEVLDVPVGIVCPAYGGTRVEAWLPREVLETYPEEDLSKEAIEKRHHANRPMLMYNAMIYPVKGYTIKGFVWYQGCSNVYAPEKYVSRLSDMVGTWRKDWRDAENALPFYQVEIAPFNYNNGTDKASLLRKSQHDAAKAIPNCGVIVTNDLVKPYEYDNIHPCMKREVGDRLAFLALNRDYGYKTIDCYSPEALGCEKVEGRDNQLAVILDNAPRGLDRWHDIKGLEVAGEDGVFYPVTTAHFDCGRKTLWVVSPSVPKPVQARYCWGDFNPGNLHTIAGLPVSPFWVKLN
jgi:sialate O-acetylesterase